MGCVCADSPYVALKPAPAAVICIHVPSIRMMSRLYKYFLNKHQWYFTIGGLLILLTGFIRGMREVDYSLIGGATSYPVIKDPSPLSIIHAASCFARPHITWCLMLW